MENLVSHEAMVKEIKNLCWDNRYREGMTVEHLAEELDALAEDFRKIFINMKYTVQFAGQHGKEKPDAN